MGKHIQWRQPNEKEPQSFGESTTFGGRRDGGRGYLAHSQRVGPGIVLVHDELGLTDEVRRIADMLCADGFTVLAPDLFDSSPELDRDRAMLRLSAALATLRDNWHPRAGAVGFGPGADLLVGLAATASLDGLVLCDTGFEEEMSDAPVLVVNGQGGAGSFSDAGMSAVADFLHHHLA